MQVRYGRPSPYRSHQTNYSTILELMHEYMDLVFFFKAINGLVVISEDVLPKPIIPTRATRSSSAIVSYRSAPQNAGLALSSDRILLASGEFGIVVQQT
jgi:hypothetical protein